MLVENCDPLSTVQNITINCIYLTITKRELMLINIKVRFSESYNGVQFSLLDTKTLLQTKYKALLATSYNKHTLQHSIKSDEMMRLVTSPHGIIDIFTSERKEESRDCQEDNDVSSNNIPAR